MAIHSDIRLHSVHRHPTCSLLYPPTSSSKVEVYGRTGARRCPGRVTYCCAGKYVTAAVMAAMDDAADVETVYKKAVQADAFNADVLRELETFFSAYDQWGRGDAIKVGRKMNRGLWALTGRRD